MNRSEPVRASERPALRRRTEHRLVAGVAGGIADRLNTSVVFVRVLLLYTALWTPMLWAYAAAALLMPPRGRNRPGWDNVVGLGRYGFFLGSSVVLFPGAESIEDLFDQSPDLWVPFEGLGLVALILVLSADYIRGRPRTEAEARATVVGALPVAGFAAMLVAGMVLAPDVRWDRVLPVGVLVAGAALLVGALAGRPRPFVAPAMVALAVAGNAVAADARLDGGVGDRWTTPPNDVRGRIEARRAYGDLTVDLRHLPPGPPLRLDASVGKGDLSVGVPNRARVIVEASVGHGQVDSIPLTGGGESAAGFDRAIRDRFTSRRPGPEPPRLIFIRAHVGVGRLDVTRGRDFQGAARW